MIDVMTPITLPSVHCGVFTNHESDLFKDSMTPQLDALRDTAGHGIGRIVLKHAIEAAERGKTGNEGLEEAMTNALTDRAASGCH